MSSYISGKHFIKTSCVTSGLLTLAVWGTLQPLNLFAGDESAEKLNHRALPRLDHNIINYETTH